MGQAFDVLCGAQGAITSIGIASPVDGALKEISVEEGEFIRVGKTVSPHPDGEADSPRLP